jgi:uncharacterized ubiquitin-like protein YukD
MTYFNDDVKEAIILRNNEQELSSKFRNNYSRSKYSLKVNAHYALIKKLILKGWTTKSVAKWIGVPEKIMINTFCKLNNGLPRQQIDGDKIERK